MECLKRQPPILGILRNSSLERRLQQTTKRRGGHGCGTGQLSLSLPQAEADPPGGELGYTPFMVWVKTKPTGDGRFWSLVPFTKVPIWYRFFEPQPFRGCIFQALGAGVHTILSQGDTLSLFQEGDTLRLFQAGDVDRGIWDTLGGATSSSD